MERSLPQPSGARWSALLTTAMYRQVESSSVRDAVVAQRTERIMEQRRATEVAEQRCRAASGGSGGGEGDVPDNQEVERSKRAELMRKERKLVSGRKLLSL